MDYKEKIELARDWYNDQSTTKKEKVLLESLFPELKESDDKIFKEVFHNLIVSNDHTPSSKEIFSLYGKTKEDCLAWLEKQGEPQPYRGNGDTMRKNLIKAFKSVGGKHWGGFDVRDIIHWLESKDAIELEKSDETYPILSNSSNIGKNEQNIAGTIETKFKVGDWVVTPYERVNQVITTNYRDEYIVLDDGSYFNRSECDNYRHWTIEDAKDGDVLCYREGQWCFIYKEIISDNAFKYYALLSKKGITIDDEAFGILSSCITPATKEQCELLFQKMKDVGYEWNADEKALVMIGIDNDEEDERYEKLMEDDETSKQNPSWSDDDEKMMQFILKYVNASVSNFDFGNIQIWFRNIKKRVQPNQWSDEDEVMLQTTIDTLEDFSKGKLPLSGSGYDIAIAEIQWLKSLKPQPQQKQEWNEEDEKNLGITILALEKPFDYEGKFDRKAAIQWLKSLKPHWKPTKEQMNALSMAYKDSLTSGENLITQTETLKSLYNDLKKL